MHVLFLAPHPFYQERGTPIAVNLILRVLSARGERVDVLTFHEGQDLQYDKVTIFRTPGWSLLNGIRPGFSLKKLICDGLLLVRAFQFVLNNRYDVIHAVEESVFVAIVLKWVFGIPFVYDMDSSLAHQMMEKYSWLSLLARMLKGFERLAIRQAQAVLPVCQALAEIVEEYHQPNVMVIHDVPLAKEGCIRDAIGMKKQFGTTDPIVMYVGNLETYQGIDLLLNSFAIVADQKQPARLVIIGGEAQDIARYTMMAEHLGVQSWVHFLGPKPVEDLSSYLAEADVLVSPRIKGNNTPMKVYSYLQSGVPVVATNLPTHTQVMDAQMAELADPTPEAFAEGILSLLQDQTKRERLGRTAQQVVKAQFSHEAFSAKINGLYDWLRTDGTTPLAVSPAFSPSPNS